MTGLVQLRPIYIGLGSLGRNLVLFIRVSCSYGTRYALLSSDR